MNLPSKPIQALAGFMLVLSLAYFHRLPGAPRSGSYLAEVGTPALALGLADSRGVLRREVTGVRVQGRPEEAAPGDQWALGASAKTLTATLAAVLEEQGRIRWDSRVQDVLPGLRGILPDYGQVTLEQLLTHHAGIVSPRVEDWPALAGGLHQMRLQAAEWLLRQPPAGPPGRAFVYSNEGYVIAAAMLEEAAGEPWEQAVAHRVLEPLGLRAKIGPPGQGDPRQPWGHRQEGGRWRAVDPAPVPSPVEQVLAPAGALVSMPLDDILAWAQINLRGLRGIPCAVLNSVDFQKLHTPADPNGYGLGWVRDTLRGRPVSWHSGSTGSLASYIILDPTRDRALVLLANGETPQGEVPGALAKLAREILD